MLIVKQFYYMMGFTHYIINMTLRHSVIIIVVDNYIFEILNQIYGN